MSKGGTQERRLAKVLGDLVVRGLRGLRERGGIVATNEGVPVGGLEGKTRPSWRL